MPTYHARMIQSFTCKETQRIYNEQTSRRFPLQIQAAGLRKLLILDAAAYLDDLRAPPGNRLEALKGDRAGQHSIRVNDQYRICFVWTGNGPANVEIVDYH